MRRIEFTPNPFVTVTDYGDALDDRTIADLEISTRLKNALSAEGLITLRQITARTRDQIARLPNVGLMCVNELVAVLRARNLFLCDDDGVVESAAIEHRQRYHSKWRADHYCDRCGYPHARECLR